MVVTAGQVFIFSFDPKTSNYTTLKNLDFLNGSHPYGSLLQASDGKFYGMTTFGGESPAFLPQTGANLELFFHLIQVRQHTRSLWI